MSPRHSVRSRSFGLLLPMALVSTLACGTHDSTRSTSSSSAADTASAVASASSSPMRSGSSSAVPSTADSATPSPAHPNAARHLASDCEVSVFADVEKLAKAAAFANVLPKVYDAADRYAQRDPDLAGFAAFAHAEGVGVRDVASVAVCARLSHPDAVSISYAVAPARVAAAKPAMPAPAAGQTAGDVDGAPVLRAGLVTMGRAEDGVLVAAVSKRVDGYREMMVGDRPPPAGDLAVDLHIGEPLLETEAGKAPVLKNVIALGLTVDAKLEHFIVRLQCRSASDAVTLSQSLEPELKKLLASDLASNPYSVNDTLKAMDVRTEGADVVADMRIAPSTLSGLAAALEKELP